MSLINSSYFTGPIKIAQLEQAGVQASLTDFISRNEDLMLQAALGYDLWNDFMNGLQLNPIPQMWLDLLQGTNFTTVNNWPAWYWGYTWFNKKWYMNSQRTTRWVGFAPSLNSTNPALPAAGQPIELVVGAGTGNPVAGSSSFQLASLSGSTFYLERRGFGTMKLGTDYTLDPTGTIITLIGNVSVFNNGDVYFIHPITVSNISVSNPLYNSPLASYIYYRYMEDLAYQTTGVGVVRSKTANADQAWPVRKMIEAWNTMAENIFILWQFLYKQSTQNNGAGIYASYDTTKIDYLFFKPQNIFSI